MANRYATQGALIAEALKRKPHTYMEMLKLGVSTCPWKRVDEWLCRGDVAEKWRLKRASKWLGGNRYVTTWRIVRA